METPGFDDAHLARKLGKLPRDHMVDFAATCAERLFPAYVAFSSCSTRGDSTALRSILDRLWDDLGGDRIQDRDCSQCLKRVWR
ncbi:MAG: DUF416 family protein [Polyangiaceae bacterium]|nr:DUF416 family protein [Polyangiaceae bacterium]